MSVSASEERVGIQRRNARGTCRTQECDELSQISHVIESSHS